MPIWSIFFWNTTYIRSRQKKNITFLLRASSCRNCALVAFVTVGEATFSELHVRHLFRQPMWVSTTFFKCVWSLCMSHPVQIDCRKRKWCKWIFLFFRRKCVSFFNKPEARWLAAWRLTKWQKRIKADHRPVVDHAVHSDREEVITAGHRSPSEDEMFTQRLARPDICMYSTLSMSLFFLTSNFSLDSTGSKVVWSKK